MDRSRILVIQLRSRYNRLVSEGLPSGAADKSDAEDSFLTQIVSAHESHMASIEKVEKTLAVRGLDASWRTSIGDVDTNEFDLVVTVGGDGTVLHASHSVGKTPVLGVNSSPESSAGFFTAVTADDFGDVLDRILEGQVKPVILCRMRIEVEGKVVTNRALNDALFCHACPASTTRYCLVQGKESEDQISSGVWVSTAAGSTAAIHAAGGKVMRPRSKKLQFAVREPFPTGGATSKMSPSLVKGFVSDDDSLIIRSKSEAARLYIDGPHVEFPIEFGNRVTFKRSDEPLRIYEYIKNKNNFA